MAAPTLSRRPVGRSTTHVLRHVDLILLAAVGALALIGVVMVYAATHGPRTTTNDTFFMERQAMFVVIGAGALAAVAAIDYRIVRDWSLVIYAGACTALVLVVSPLGSEAKGIKGWFQLGPFQLQPSEFAKIAVIIALAGFLSSDRVALEGRRLLGALALAGFPMALIMLQPDLGTVLVFCAASVGMLLVAGVRPRHVAIMAVVAALAVTAVLTSDLLAEYQKARLTNFVNPGAVDPADAYNLEQSQIAIANGGITGQGLFQGGQTSNGFVPEQQTDFIFTAVGEELGFVGASLVLALYAVVLWRVWRTAQLARDSFGVLVCAGVFAMLLFQIFQNVGMTMGIMPITGIPLPFMSYGGSSIISMFVAVGLVLNVHMRRFT
ncbi:MAG TPA: rod shape-determining protein RodA [Acidimicrobiales bacterium]|nr:rod shape-determining protein RodA [Acidimicrobiales bacterium]